MIFDPFCGKGTTLLAARLLGFAAYGMDIAPEAVLCTTAKLVGVNFQSLRSYITSMRLIPQPLRRVPSSVRAFFHRRTLAELLSVRDKLICDLKSSDDRKRANATFVAASLLGILHGHASYSLSISSAHAYSMAPGYVLRYAADHGLKPPVRKVKACLLEKMKRCLDASLPECVQFDVRRGSAISCSSVFPELVGKVDLILTSPPYLNAQTYAKDNWLRLWLLGFDHKALKPEYIETGSIQCYKGLMRVVFQELYKMLKPGGRLICIAGDVRSRTHRPEKNGNGFVKTGALLAGICESKAIGFHIEEYQSHEVPSSCRYFHALSRSNGHRVRSLTERVFVARKPHL